MAALGKNEQEWSSLMEQYGWAKPKVWMPDDKNNPLLGVLAEAYPNFIILWFHWLKDGLFNEEDYEPIIIVKSPAENNVCYLVTRLHWRYQYYWPEVGLEIPIKIIFHGSQHAPLPRTQDNAYEYEGLAIGLVAHNYDNELRFIQPSFISEKFRTGKGHQSALGYLVDDPATIGEWLHSGFCHV
jgi:hypothetical protein